MGEMQLGAEATAVAKRISAIDRKLDDLERKVTGYISQGLRFGGGSNRIERAEDDEERGRLLRQRADLANRLRAITTDG